MALHERGAADASSRGATNRMKLCPNCHSQYPDDANFCPQETCATDQGPRRLEPVGSTSAAAPPPSRYEMESQLGGARTGEVWRARDTQTGATVAYKLVAQASLPTTAASERAQRELKQLTASSAALAIYSRGNTRPVIVFSRAIKRVLGKCGSSGLIAASTSPKSSVPSGRLVTVCGWMEPSTESPPAS